MLPSTSAFLLRRQHSPSSSSPSTTTTDARVKDSIRNKCRRVAAAVESVEPHYFNIPSSWLRSWSTHRRPPARRIMPCIETKSQSIPGPSWSGGVLSFDRHKVARWTANQFEKKSSIPLFVSYYHGLVKIYRYYIGPLTFPTDGDC